MAGEPIHPACTQCTTLQEQHRIIYAVHNAIFWPPLPINFRMRSNVHANKEHTSISSLTAWHTVSCHEDARSCMIFVGGCIMTLCFAKMISCACPHACLLCFCALGLSSMQVHYVPVVAVCRSKPSICQVRISWRCMATSALCLLTCLQPQNWQTLYVSAPLINKAW